MSDVSAMSKKIGYKRLIPCSLPIAFLCQMGFLTWATLAYAAGDSILPTPAQDALKPAPARTLKIVESEILFPIQGKHVHSSSLVELSDGSLLAAWFHGSGEKKADDVRVMGARKLADNQTWSEPFVLADTPDHPDCNPVLWIDKNERLWLFWSTILSNEWESSLIKYRVSTNYEGMSGPPQWDWQDTVHIKPANFQQDLLRNWRQLLGTVTYLPRVVQAELTTMPALKLLRKKTGLLVVLALVSMSPLGFHWWREKKITVRPWKRLVFRTSMGYAMMLLLGASGAIGYFAIQSNPTLNQRLGWLTANKPLQLETGEIVLPLYSDRFVASIMAISKDEGKTWEASQPIVGYGNIQPSIIERTNGQMVALMRENGARKCIRYSVSNNQGRNWTPVQETSLPNPGSKVHAIALRNGDWALAYNNLVDGRHAISLALSHDEGESWQPPLLLDSETFGNATFSYPCLQESSDGRIHLTYSFQKRLGGNPGETIKHICLEELLPNSPVSIPEGVRNMVR